MLLQVKSFHEVWKLSFIFLSYSFLIPIHWSSTSFIRKESGEEVFPQAQLYPDKFSLIILYLACPDSCAQEIPFSLFPVVMSGASRRRRPTERRAEPPATPGEASGSGSGRRHLGPKRLPQRSVGLTVGPPINSLHVRQQHQRLKKTCAKHGRSPDSDPTVFFSLMAAVTDGHTAVGSRHEQGKNC